jgi:hypothetical protein
MEDGLPALLYLIAFVTAWIGCRSGSHSLAVVSIGGALAIAAAAAWYHYAAAGSRQMTAELRHPAAAARTEAGAGNIEDSEPARI